MSSWGMKYIFVLYDYDSNVILAAPMKSRKGSEMVKAFDECYQQLKTAGITPILQYLDNEVSKTVAYQSKTVGTRSSLWYVQLQSNTNISTWNEGNHP